jgi:hypothetical protein
VSHIEKNTKPINLNFLVRSGILIYMLINLLLLDSFNVSETNFSITSIGGGGSSCDCSGWFGALDVMWHQNYMYSQYLFFALLLCSSLTTHEDNICSCFGFHEINI